MIDKADFYHGAALATALDDARCIDIARWPPGYLVNDEVLALVKYTTKGGSPWQFTFSTEDVARLQHCPDGVDRVVLAMVCGGDGICTISAEAACKLLDETPAWIAVRRKFHGWYGISGPAGALESKVPPRRWPEILFQAEESLDEHEQDAAPDLRRRAPRKGSSQRPR
jgi:hypothetical protein